MDLTVFVLFGYQKGNAMRDSVFLAVLLLSNLLPFSDCHAQERVAEEQAKVVPATAAGATRKVVFIAGPRSHANGACFLKQASSLLKLDSWVLKHDHPRKPAQRKQQIG